MAALWQWLRSWPLFAGLAAAAAARGPGKYSGSPRDAKSSIGDPRRPCRVRSSEMFVGMSIPTCKEGLSLPTPFCSPEQVVRMCIRAEALGYHSVWGNDHITPPKYVRDDYPEPPNFYEPLITLAFAAQATSSLRLGTSVLVLPMREPTYLAKTVATLDAFSGGRLILGVGVGAY